MLFLVKGWRNIYLGFFDINVAVKETFRRHFEPKTSRKRRHVIKGDAFRRAIFFNFSEILLRQNVAQNGLHLRPKLSNFFAVTFEMEFFNHYHPRYGVTYACGPYRTNRRSPSYSLSNVNRKHDSTVRTKGKRSKHRHFEK